MEYNWFNGFLIGIYAIQRQQHVWVMALYILVGVSGVNPCILVADQTRSDVVLAGKQEW